MGSDRLLPQHFYRAHQNQPAYANSRSPLREPPGTVNIHLAKGRHGVFRRFPQHVNPGSEMDDGLGAVQQVAPIGLTVNRLDCRDS